MFSNKCYTCIHKIKSIVWLLYKLTKYLRNKRLIFGQILFSIKNFEMKLFLNKNFHFQLKQTAFIGIDLKIFFLGKNVCLKDLHGINESTLDDTALQPNFHLASEDKNTAHKGLWR